MIRKGDWFGLELISSGVLGNLSTEHLFQNVGWQVWHLKCYRWQMNIALQEKLEQKGPLWISQQS